MASAVNNCKRKTSVTVVHQRSHNSKNSGKLQLSTSAEKDTEELIVISPTQGKNSASCIKGSEVSNEVVQRQRRQSRRQQQQIQEEDSRSCTGSFWCNQNI